jgi:hypothetical protein
MISDMTPPEIGFLLNDEKTLITLPMDVPLTNLNDCLNYFHEFGKFGRLSFPPFPSPHCIQRSNANKKNKRISK